MSYNGEMVYGRNTTRTLPTVAQLSLFFNQAGADKGARYFMMSLYW